MKRRRIHLAWRALAAVGLLMLLGGPGPGSVGSCSEYEADIADAPQYCVNKNEALCRRTRLMCGPGVPACDRAYILCTEGDATAMPPVPRLIERCARSGWPGTCEPPTTSQANACIAALLADDAASLAVTNEQAFMDGVGFAQCADIQCASTTSGLVAPEDASVPMPDGSTEVP